MAAVGDCVKEILIACGGNVLTDLWHEKAVDDMKEKAGLLTNVSNEIKAELDRQQRKPKGIVHDWIVKVDTAITLANSIGEEYQEHGDNFLGRCGISKRIRHCQEELDKLHSVSLYANFLPRGEYGNAPDQVPIQTSGLIGNGIQDAQLKIESLLTKDSIRVIGVHGMAGVGKTSLLVTINNIPEVRRSFAPIIWLTISQEYTIFDLQSRIGERLNLELPNGSDMRKDTLCSYLKDKYFLLILDDIRNPLDLEGLGVPLQGTGKIVLSTRKLEVCRSMNANESIQVNSLSPEEGWQLFRNGAFRNRSSVPQETEDKGAFQKVNVPEEIEMFAREIAAKCQGLPLAINVVAAAMKKRTHWQQWQYALEQMQAVDKSFYKNNEIEEKLWQPLRWSYDDLPHEWKLCCVYFAAYPKGKKILCERIIDIWIAEGMMGGSRDNARHFIDSLADRCLIEVVSKDFVGRIERVKIHDVLRDMVIFFADHSCYFKAGQTESRFPEKEVYGNRCARMSLMCNDLQSLPTAFACSSLSVLLLKGNLGIKEVPESFLHQLYSLRVLDLSYTGITYLPACIGHLKRLASLQLKSTGICELPEAICDLKELQFLNVARCEQLQCLPERISKLTRLRALEISYCGMSRLPRGISKLVLLEILRTESISWNFEESENLERKYACLKDLQHLNRLRVFSGMMSSTFKNGVLGNWSKMRDLSLICANHDDLPQDMKAMKDLESLTLCNVERLPGWFSEFRKLVMLQLAPCRQLKELPAELRELPCLKWLSMCGWDKLEKLELGIGFRKLEVLRLWEMGGLESLECVGAEEAASGSRELGEGAPPISRFKSLEVRGCKKLKTLRGKWDKLKCLEKISGGREWWDAIQWDNSGIGTFLEGKFSASYWD